jgi:hypothetical protein
MAQAVARSDFGCGLTNTEQVFSKPRLSQTREKARLLCVHITQRTNALGELPTSALSFANLTQILEQSDRRIIATRTLRADERLDLPPGGGLVDFGLRGRWFMFRQGTLSSDATDGAICGARSISAADCEALDFRALPSRRHRGAC